MNDTFIDDIYFENSDCVISADIRKYPEIAFQYNTDMLRDPRRVTLLQSVRCENTTRFHKTGQNK